MKVGKTEINEFWLIRHLPISKEWELRWARDAIDRHYSHELDRCKDTKDPDLLERIRNDWQFQAVLNDDEEAELYSRNLLRRARHLRVPVPAMYDERSKLRIR